MAENTIDTLQIKIESESNSAASSLDNLVNVLYRLSPALSNAETGFKNFEGLILNVSNQFREFRENIEKPFKINVDTSSFSNTSNIQEIASNFRTLFDGLSVANNVNTEKIIEIGNSLRVFTTALSGGERIDGNVARIFTALSALSTSANNLDAIINKLPLLSKGIEKFITLLSSAPEVTESTSQLVEALSRLSASGRKAEQILPVLPRLATGIMDFSNSLSGAGEGAFNSMSNLSRGLADLAMAISQFSAIRVGDINRSVTALERLGNANFGTLAQNLQSIAGLDFSSLNRLGVAFQQFTSSLAGSENVPATIGRIFSSLSQLAASAQNIPTVTANLPLLSSEIGRFVSSMAAAPTVQDGTVALVSALSGIANAGRRVQQTTNALPGLAQGLSELFTVLSGLPHLDKNIVDVISALSRLSPVNIRAGNSANSLQRNIKGLSLSMLDLHSSTKKVTTGVKSFARQLLGAMGIYVSIYGLVRGIKSAIDISSKLTEVQNVVDVTFGDMKQKLEDLASVSIKDFGMSELTTKQVASRFQAMGVAMGFTQEKMSDMSIQLTKLTADMASFYDVSQEKVAEKLASIFTGTTRPLRDFGLDLTQATLQEWALAQGMDVNIQKMSQAEKTMLRYQYVLANTTAAQNDFQRTAGTWANQTRILIQQFQQLGSVIGGVFINAFKPLVKTLNSVMSSIITFAKTVANALGVIFGWTIEINSGGVANDFEAAGEGAEAMEDGTGGAAKNLKDMNKYIAAWHEVNNMTTDEDKAGGGGGGGGGGLGDELGDAAEAQLKRTESLFDKYKSEIDTLYKLGEYIGETLTSAMNNIDWDGIYQGAKDFGHGLAEFLNGLISPELFGALGKTIAGAINTAIKTALGFGEAFDFTELGVSIGEGVNKALESIDWNDALKAAQTWGIGIANTINGFIRKADFNLVGSSIANAVNTAVELAFSFGLTLDWEGVGNTIANSINGFFNTFDFSKLAETLNIWAKGILESAITAIENVQWVTIGQKIGEFLQELDLLEVGMAVGRLLWDAISAGVGMTAGMFNIAPIETGIATLLAALVISPKIISGIAAAKTAIDGLKAGIAGLATAAAANPLIAIGAAITVIATALYSFGKNWDAKKAQEFIQFQKDIGSNTSDLELAADHLREVGSQTRYLIDNADQDSEKLGKLADSYFELADKSSLTGEEQKKLKKYAQELTEQVPLLGNAIDTVTGKYSAQKDEIYKLIEAQQAHMQVEAYQKVMEKYSEAMAETNVELAIATEQYNTNSEKLKEYGEALDHIQDTGLNQWAKEHEQLLKDVGVTYKEGVTGIDELRTAYENYSQEVELSGDAMAYAQKELEHANQAYDVAKVKMEEQSELYDSLVEGSTEYQQALSDLQTDLSNLNITLSEDFTKNLVKGNYDTSGLKEYFASIQQGVSADSYKLQKLFNDMGLSLPEEFAKALEGKDAETQSKAVALLMGIQSGVQATAPQLTELFGNLGITLPDNLTQNLSQKGSLVQSTTIELLSKVQRGYKLTEGNLITLFQGLGLNLPDGLIKSLVNKESEVQQQTIELLSEIQDGYDGSAPELLQKFNDLGIDLPDSFKKAMESEDENVRNQAIQLFGQILKAKEGEEGPLLEAMDKLGSNASEELNSGLDSHSDDILETSKKQVNSVKQPAQDEFSSANSGPMYDAGANASKGFWQGVKDWWDNSWLVNAVTNFKNTITDLLDIHSPSKVMKQYGAFTIQGFNIGLKNEIPETYDTVNNWVNKLKSGSISTIDLAIPDFDFSPPKVDLSPKSYSAGSFQNTMRMEMDAKMASLEFENRQLRESVEECVALLESIYEKPALSDDAVFNSARRGQRSYNKRTRLTGWSGIDA